MWDQFQTARRGWRRACLVWLLCAGVALGATRSARGHNFLGEFIQHGIQLTVGAQHIDVTVDLTFFEEWSAREREAMDADDSGDITRVELENYLKRLAPQLARQVKLQFADRELALVPLYEPEIDLLGDNQVGPAHHRLRLFFFAPTPELRAGDELVIESDLWPEAKAIATPQSEGRDGCKLTTLISVDAGLTTFRSERETSLIQSSRIEALDPGAPPPPALAPAPSGGEGGRRPGEGEVHGRKRLFKFRCLQPPLPKASPVNPPAARAVESAPSPCQPSGTGVAPVSDISVSVLGAGSSHRTKWLMPPAGNVEMETGATPVLRCGTESAPNAWPRSPHL